MSSQDQQKGKNMEKSNLESTQEFYDQWVNMYKTTMGKFIEMPAVGPSREKSEKMMKGVSTFVNLFAAGMDTSSNMQNVFMEAMQKVQEKIGTDMDGEISPEKYKEFYDIWIQTYSETFKDFAKSGHFVSDLGKLNAHLIDFQKYNRDMLEDNYLKPMNMPTKTEIDEINKELTDRGKKLPGHKNLTSITGIGDLSATILLNTIGDVDDFGDDKKLAAYFGIVPRVAVSNETSQYGKITKRGNKIARTALVQSTLIAIRYNHYLRRFYFKLKAKKGSGKAIIATARKLLTIVYRTLKNDWVFEDFNKFKLAVSI